jgi:hypothetical protein
MRPEAALSPRRGEGTRRFIRPGGTVGTGSLGGLGLEGGIHAAQDGISHELLC